MLYADDTKCLKQINDLEDYSALQQDLHNLAIWSDYWHLPFNESKCILLRFTSRPVDPFLNQIYIKHCPVAIKENYKDLGVIMSHDLSWRKQHDYVLAKAY